MFLTHRVFDGCRADRTPGPRTEERMVTQWSRNWDV